MMGLLSLFKRRRPEKAPLCSAVIVAAGSARRMEGIDKVLAPLGELPVLVHTLYAFQDCPAIHEIVVVTREDLLVEVSRICKDFAFHKVTKVVVGGAERIGSVQAGLREADPAWTDQTQIAEQLHISQVQVSRLEKKILRQMREYLER